MNKLELQHRREVAERRSGDGLPALWLVIAFVAAALFFWLRFP